MKSKKLNKLALIALVILIACQLPWYVAVESYANRNFTKTSATVVDITNTGKCTNLWSRRHIACKAPVYEYRDRDGNTARYTDLYVTSFTKDSIYKKNKGDTVTVYYSDNKNEDPFFRSGISANIAWLLPSYLAFILSVLYIIVIIVRYAKLYLEGEL